MMSTSRYPVDRYMVDSSKNMEMVNIIGEDLWNPEPTLRPEDEIILRKLHDMLQSTSDDLKLLSGELAKYHEPGIRIKTSPTPLDEEFNEKVHIEELVNAKFHGYKIIDKSSAKLQNSRINEDKVLVTKPIKPKVINTAVQVNTTPPVKTKTINRNLGISRTRIVQINEKSQGTVTTERLNNGKIRNALPIAYNEFSYKYVEPQSKDSKCTKFQIQIMPSINIRSELKEQKVLNIDILPNEKGKQEFDSYKSNVSVIVVNHDEPTQTSLKTRVDPILSILPNLAKPVRKISKMSTCESSDSTCPSSDARLKLNTRNKLITSKKDSARNTIRSNNRKKLMIVKEPDTRHTTNLEEWRRKLNMVYGTPSSKNVKTNIKKKVSPKKLGASTRTGTMNNAEYIPYSQLTLGGIRVSDIERELTSSTIKNNESLSQILEKIMNSRENSPRKSKNVTKILTTSDENLLQEVIDIERTVSDTISKNINRKETDISKANIVSKDDNDKHDSYDDDFEDEKSDNTIQSENEINVSGSEQNIYPKDVINDSDFKSDEYVPEPCKLQNTTFTKTSNLSIKDSVDIFEFVHSVDTQDIAIQSDTSNKIIPKETQTSPRNDKPNIHPIHNDLWPSLDPKGEIERMLKLEKEFIKKLIIDEYGDLLEKNIAKPSTSKESVEDSGKNISASQKNTQTSPARVKSVMTSPKRTKTRTTSPFVQQLTITADQQTSPMRVATDEEEVNIESLDITTNLSSPRFSLRLPQTSRDVLSNLDVFKQSSKIKSKSTLNKTNVTSSSSVGAGSSSELSSIGEVRLPFRKKLKKTRVQTISESSSSSSLSKFSSDFQSYGIIPLKSEGEISLGQKTKKVSNKSEGEASFGVFY